MKYGLKRNLSPFGCIGGLHQHIATKFYVDQTSHFRICEKCGVKYAEDKHSFGADGVCAVCGFSPVYTDGLEYAYDAETDSYAVVGAGAISGASALFLPAYYNGKPVTQIGKQAFDRRRDWKSAVLPSSIRSIGDAAFRNCRTLERINIPSCVDSIGVAAFNGCFELKEMRIPASVTSIGSSAFSGCSALEHIEVAEENPVYRGEGNCIVERSTGRLVVGCKNSRVPKGVVSIGRSAFYGHGGLKSIELPEGVAEIGMWAFAECRELTSVTIPASVTFMEIAAFWGDIALVAIRYDGTMSAWKAIKKQEYWDQHLKNYAVYCTDGTVDKDGTEHRN